MVIFMADPRCSSAYVVFRRVQLCVCCLRLSLSGFPSATVQIHGLDVRTDWASKPDIKTELDSYRTFTQERHEQLIQETIRQANRGAQIVLWTEMAASGVVEDTDLLLTRAQEVANEEEIYLAIGLEAHYPD